VDLSPAAWRDLQRVSRTHPEAFRVFITRGIPQLVTDPLGASEPMHGDLAGWRSYHFHRQPEFRAIFVILQRLVLVHVIGPHDDAYRRARDRR
jgi:hypothetical protein